MRWEGGDNQDYVVHPTRDGQASRPGRVEKTGYGPPNIRFPNFPAASSSISSVTCEYTSAVSRMDACPLCCEFSRDQRYQRIESLTLSSCSSELRRPAWCRSLDILGDRREVTRNITSAREQGEIPELISGQIFDWTFKVWLANRRCHRQLARFSHTAQKHVPR
jgi:hypothetical protein